MHDFPVDYNSIDISDILNIHKYLKDKSNTMFSLIKLVFIVLLCFCESLTTKCISSNNEPCMIRPFLIELNLVKLKCHSFMISLDQM